jgi:hypothetical protein
MNNKVRQVLTIVRNMGNNETKSKLTSTCKNLENRKWIKPPSMFITMDLNHTTGRFNLKFKETLDEYNKTLYQKQFVYGYNYILKKEYTRDISFFFQLVRSKKLGKINNNEIFYSPTKAGARKSNEFYCVYYEKPSGKCFKHNVHYHEDFDSCIIFFKQLKNKNEFITNVLKKNKLKYTVHKLNFNKVYRDPLAKKILPNTNYM